MIRVRPCTRKEGSRVLDEPQARERAEATKRRYFRKYSSDF
jgi:hypothetical protein